MKDSHKQYERKQVIWLFISFGLIALMAVGVMLLGAAQAGLFRRFAGQLGFTGLMQAGESRSGRRGRGANPARS